MKYEPVKDQAERKRIFALIEQCEKEQTMSEVQTIISGSHVIPILTDGIYFYVNYDGTVYDRFTTLDDARSAAIDYICQD